MILVDATIAIEKREYTPEGIAIERYEGPALDDVGLIRFAAREGHRVVVVVADGYLLSSQVIEAAKACGVSLVVVSDTHPFRAAQRVKQFAREIVASGSHVLRLLGHGPEPQDVS